MPETTEEKAEAAVEAVLDGGQASTIGDVSIQKTPASAAYSILQAERDAGAQKAGRRPLFRGVNMGGMAG